MKIVGDAKSDHTWERRRWPRYGSRGVFVLQCSACAAWGWANAETPDRVTVYKDAFVEPPRPPAEPTAQPRLEADKAPKSTRDVDAPPRSRGPRIRNHRVEYAPRHTLADWEKRR